MSLLNLVPSPLKLRWRVWHITIRGSGSTVGMSARVLMWELGCKLVPKVVLTDRSQSIASTIVGLLIIDAASACGFVSSNFYGFSHSSATQPVIVMRQTLHLNLQGSGNETSPYYACSAR